MLRVSKNDFLPPFAAADDSLSDPMWDFVVVVGWEFIVLTMTTGARYSMPMNSLDV